MAAELPFGLWLQKRRKALDLTREELARQVGCSTSALRKIEADERRPSKQMAALLAAALGLPPEESPTFVRIARRELSIERLGTVQPSPLVPSLQPSPPLSFPLPVPPTQLVGREHELSALRLLWGDTQCRMVTLVGPGGSGKTRLALELAWEEPGTVAFVSLASVTTSELLVPAIADGLGLAFPGPCCLEDKLVEFLREKQILLILDNMEHLLEGARFISELLQRAPGLKLLCTSREPLSLRGEWVFEVGGLDVPQDHQAADLEGYSATALFLQRARQTVAGFSLRPEDRRAIVRICRMVGGMPLAIELAASWARTLSCAEIEEEIEANLDFLSTALRDVPERHRSMRAVFNHSWRLISAEEQQVLAALTVFRGGFTREAAGQVAHANLELISALVAKSLLQRTGAKRFGMHELVRQYAARRLEATEDLEPVRLGHVSFFTDLAEKGRDWFTGPMMPAWLECMEKDNDNLRAALDYAIGLPASETALRLGAAMWRFWECRGQIDEGRRWLDSVLALPAEETQEYTRARAQALSSAGSLARIQGDFACARRFHEESLALRRKDGDIRGIATSLNGLGILTMFEGQYDAAAAYLEESLQLCRQLGIKAEIVRRLNNLGIVAMYQGDYEKARRLHEDTLKMYLDLNDRHGQAGALGNLGDVLRYQGDHEQALQVLNESLAILQEIGDAHGMVVTLGSMARVQLARGEVDQALATFHTSLLGNREVGDKTEMANALEGIADALGKYASRPVGREDETRLAVRLAAAAGQLRVTVGAPCSAAEQVELDRILALLRGQLPESDFFAEWQCGAAMTGEQAVEAALSHLVQIPSVDGVS